MYGLGLVATIIGMLGAIPYIHDTFRRKTKPHRVAWLIFLVLSVVSFASQFALGARASLFFYGWFVANNVIIVALSLRKNGGYGDASTINVVCFCLAIASVVLWKMTNAPLTALICVLIADGIGSMLIVIKAYKHPNSETLVMWVLGILACFLNIIAVGSTKFALLAAPVEIFLFNVAIVAAMLIGKRKPLSGRKKKAAET